MESHTELPHLPPRTTTQNTHQYAFHCPYRHCLCCPRCSRSSALTDHSLARHHILMIVTNSSLKDLLLLLRSPLILLLSKLVLRLSKIILLLSKLLLLLRKPFHLLRFPIVPRHLSPFLILAIPPRLLPALTRPRHLPRNASRRLRWPTQS